MVLGCIYYSSACFFLLGLFLFFPIHVAKYKCSSLILIIPSQIQAYECVLFIDGPIDACWSCCQYFDINWCMFVSHICKTFSMCVPRGALLGSTHFWSFIGHCQMTLQFAHPSVVGERFCLPHMTLNTFQMQTYFCQFDFLKTQYLVILFEFPSLLVRLGIFLHIYWLLKFPSL